MTTDEATTRQLLERFRAVRLSLGEIMTIAEKRHNGSRTVQIDFDPSLAPVYRVRTVRNNQIWENSIDAETGSITSGEIAMSLQELSVKDRENIMALKSVRQQMSDATRVAEKAASGQALGGGLITTDGKMNFVILVVSGDRLKEVTLEPPGGSRATSIQRRSP